MSYLNLETSLDFSATLSFHIEFTSSTKKEESKQNHTKPDIKECVVNQAYMLKQQSQTDFTLVMNLSTGLASFSRMSSNTTDSPIFTS